MIQMSLEVQLLSSAVIMDSIHFSNEHYETHLFLLKGTDEHKLYLKLLLKLMRIKITDAGGGRRAF